MTAALLLSAFSCSVSVAEADNKFEPFECKYVGTVPCVSGATYTGDENYCFLEGNYGCEEPKPPIAQHLILDSQSFYLYGDGVDNLSQPSVALDTAVAKWNGIANVQITHDSDEDRPGYSHSDKHPDEVNRVGMINGKCEDDECLEGGAWAITWVTIEEETPDDGEMVTIDCDTEVYARYDNPDDPEYGKDNYIKWDLTDTDDPWGAALSLPSVFTHELGHVLGLGDNGLETTAMYNAMAWGDTLKPESEDIAALKFIYP